MEIVTMQLAVKDPVIAFPNASSVDCGDEVFQSRFKCKEGRKSQKYHDCLSRS